MNVADLLHMFSTKERITIAASGLITLLALLLQSTGANSILVFVVAGLALAALAALVGDATDQLGQRMGPGATGVLQSALGNLPELFISIFALRAGLLAVVQSALVGSILANSLLVLGIAFLAGGLRHGVQCFGASRTRMIANLTMLSVAALIIPSLATAAGAPDVGHAEGLSLVCALVLLLVFGASIPSSIGGREIDDDTARVERQWPMWLTLVLLVAAGLAAAFASDWFVNALKPAMAQLRLSEEFVGLVIVAIAGNAVENVVGVQMAVRNQQDYAISLILNSSLQVALALTPLLVIISRFIGGTHLTLVLSPLLLAALALTAILGTVIVYDGESTWLEGAALVGLYIIIAASFWWGPPVTA